MLLRNMKYSGTGNRHFRLHSDFLFRLLLPLS